jgi:hypothetical protein
MTTFNEKELRGVGVMEKNIYEDSVDLEQEASRKLAFFCCFLIG